MVGKDRNHLKIWMFWLAPWMEDIFFGGIHFCHLRTWSAATPEVWPIAQLGIYEVYCLASMEIHAGHQFSRTNVPNVHRIECCVVVFAGLCHFVNLQLQSCFNQRVGFSKSKGPWDPLERGFPRPSQFPRQPNCGYKNCRPSFHNSIFFFIPLVYS